MAYIQREGGTVSRPLLCLASQILLAHQRHVQILPVFVSSEENLLADAASRFQTLPDWSLPIEVFRRMVRRLTLPEIDLFATMASVLTQPLFAWGDTPGAEALDALPQPWNFRLAYAFPPLLQVIRKIRVSSGIFLLVMPFWPAQKWFPAVLGLQVMDVHRLPATPCNTGSDWPHVRPSSSQASSSTRL